MTRRNLQRRLAALETYQFVTSTTNDGHAPAAWTRLATWACLALDDDATTVPDDVSPYERIGHLWLLTHFWQRGTNRWLSGESEQTALAVIRACVNWLQRQGMTRRELCDWRTGQQVWQQVWTACAEPSERDNEYERT